VKSRICIKTKANLAFGKQTSLLSPNNVAFCLSCCFLLLYLIFLTFLGGDEYLLIYDL